MNVLFIHQNFPGQFVHLAPALRDRGHDIKVLTLSDRPVPTGIEVVRYHLERTNGKDTHPWLVDIESKVIRGEAAMRAARHLCTDGYVPDLIVAHPGWGESLFLKTVWPKAKLLAYCEYFYGAQGSEIGFDPEFSPARADDVSRLALKNINNLMHLDLMDCGITPTRWQQASYPERVQPKITVVHDGIDTEVVKPNAQSWLQLARVRLTKADEVITFVNRNLEPTRGFAVFMRALPALLRARPQARVVIVGGDEVSYGIRAPNGLSWREYFLAELSGQLDIERVHFLGRVPYQHYLSILQVSTVHVYLTHPFILSWSLLEAMACGCAIVASKTAPVEEAVIHDQHGLLVDFFSQSQLLDAINLLLDDPTKRNQLGKAARKRIIKHYDLHKVCLPKQVHLIEGLINQ